jgi:hypothetical protein
VSRRLSCTIDNHHGAPYQNRPAAGHDADGHGLELAYVPLDKLDERLLAAVVSIATSMHVTYDDMSGGSEAPDLATGTARCSRHSALAWR